MRVGVGIQPTHQPDRIAGQVAPGLRVVIAVPVVVQAGLGVVVLAREAQVERQAAGGDGLAEGPVVGFPGDGAGGIGQHLGRAQVIDVDLVDRIVGEIGQRVPSSQTYSAWVAPLSASISASSSPSGP